MIDEQLPSGMNVHLSLSAHVRVAAPLQTAPAIYYNLFLGSTDVYLVVNYARMMSLSRHISLACK